MDQINKKKLALSIFLIILLQNIVLRVLSYTRTILFAILPMSRGVALEILIFEIVIYWISLYTALLVVAKRLTYKDVSSVVKWVVVVTAILGIPKFFDSFFTSILSTGTGMPILILSSIVYVVNAYFCTKLFFRFRFKNADQKSPLQQ